MPRLALSVVAGGVVAGLSMAGVTQDPHVDPTVLPETCNTCHRGHGAPRSPMLAEPQSRLCLSCHGSEADVAGMKRGRWLDSSRSPQLLSSVLAQPFTHPVDEQAYSRDEPGIVACTSCHSAHRGSTGSTAEGNVPGTSKMSSRDPSRWEYETCNECHGGLTAAARDPRDIRGLISPRNRSYHPVEAPSREGSASVIPSLSGGEVSCTDCHGNDDPGGARGPHGSSVAFILRAGYATTDGNDETTATYALCYQCHDRERVLASSAFPAHRLHVVDERASCSTCHNPHGSADNRALIRFGEEPGVVAVSGSISTGRLAFESPGPGSGACFVTCHGYDHAPSVYGGEIPVVEALGSITAPPPPAREPVASPPSIPPTVRPRKLREE